MQLQILCRQIQVRLLLLGSVIFALWYLELFETARVRRTASSWKLHAVIENISQSDTITLTATEGACSRRAREAGESQKVISYCLYGENPSYYEGLEDILKTAANLFIGWNVWLYTDPRGREWFLDPLLDRYPYFYVCDVKNLPEPLGDIATLHPMMWRFAPLFDPQVSIFLSRDSDYQAIERELDAVIEWIISNKTLHVMRDHPSHNSPILGGMWGINKLHRHYDYVKIWENLFQCARNQTAYSIDQACLHKYLWSAMQGDVIGHDSYTCWFPDSVPWPTQRVGYDFVGNPGYRYGIGYPLPHECPKECRPKGHLDWKYC